MTGCRKAEIFGARWSEIDAAEMLWRLPRQRSKNAHPHVVPLAPQAWAIIAAQPRFAGCDYIFTTDGRRSIGGSSRLKSSRQVMQPAAPWVLHDTRRTAASGMQRLGIRVEVIDRCSTTDLARFEGSSAFTSDTITSTSGVPPCSAGRISSNSSHPAKSATPSCRCAGGGGDGRAAVNQTGEGIQADGQGCEPQNAVSSIL